MIAVNKPEGIDELAPDFPRGKTADILWKVRQAVTECAKEEGWTFIGAGIGCGGENSDGMADISLSVNGRCIEITIDMPRAKQ